FLDPPAAELPATALPDAATQQRMLDAARAYAVQTWSRLPNFFVTRATTRFDDTPQVLVKGDWPVRLGLHPVGNTTREVTFQNGKEVQDPTAEKTAAAKSSLELGLRTWGEFGPAMTVVLADMSRQKVAFSHWEQSSSGLAAVYRYTVPREASHYGVAYCCLVDQELGGRVQFGYSGRDRTAQQMSNIPKGAQYHTFNETPGYHGTISIDPATGAVLRITIEAELSQGDPLTRADTVVEYGPVTIGDRKFICPVRSLAVSLEPGGAGSKSMALNGTGDDSAWESPLSGNRKAPVLLVNETRFANYHRLGTSMRIVTNAPLSNATGSGEQAPAASSSGPTPAANAATPPLANAEAATQENPGAKTPEPSAAAPALPAPPPEPVVPEITLTDAKGIPGSPADASASSYSLKVTSRLVDVGIVAYDKKNRPVTDLKASDFEVYDNGQKQEIRSFSQDAAQAATAQEPTPVAQNAVPSAEPASSNEPVREFSNRAGEEPGEASAANTNFTILLIDESHIAWSDMNNARGQILKFLASLAPGERVGLYSMTGLGFRVLSEVTTDHTALVARMQKFMPTAQSVAAAQEEETRNRQHFDEVHNASDLNSVNGNHVDAPDSTAPIDPQLMTMGDDPARASFIILAQVARHLSSLPGHKKLVWVSSDNVFADWRDQAVGIEKSPKDVQTYAMRAQEAMNEAHAAVYPFDVSQLETGGVSSDLQHQNVQLTQAAQDNASLGGGRTLSQSTQPGRIEAAMSQDVHPVQGPVRQVAAATGGRVIRRSGDLEKELTGIVADGHATYMLGFSPQGSADGQYHAITVKLTGRRGLTLRYRTGYLFDKEPATLRERFQKAVWDPADISEIMVSANLAPAGPEAKVMINMAAKDLGLEQQGGRWMDKLDIFFIERDDAGIHAQVEGQTLGLRLRSPTYERLMPGGIPFEHVVAMKPGMASLRVLVVDENSGRMGSVTIPGSALETGN
ncbi:MAG TPA: VWA domain-containing protein, partial [Terracidiphilus sp.]|nr:VWA domain-containing protein [Terracidiphilus sp.]